MALPKLTREIVYEKKAAKYEGVGRFAHKLQQFYEFYLIGSFLFLKITTGNFFPPKQLKHEPVLDPLFWIIALGLFPAVRLQHFPAHSQSASPANSPPLPLYFYFYGFILTSK